MEIGGGECYRAISIALVLSVFGSILAALDRYYAPLDLISITLALYLAFRLSASKPPAESPRNSRAKPRRPAI